MRLFGHYVLDSRVRLFVAEQAGAGVLFLAAVASGGLVGGPAVLAAVVSVGALQAALYLADLYEPRETLSPVRWSLAAGLGALVAALVWSQLGEGRPGLWLAALALATVLGLLLRGVALHRPRRAIVVGSGTRAQALVARLAGTRAECVAVGSFGGSEEGGEVVSLFERGESLERVAVRLRADLVIVATDGKLPEEALARARASGLEVISAAGFTARYLRRLPPELVTGEELAFGEGFTATRLSDLAMRGLDLLAALLLLLLAGPILLCAMLAIRLESRGPVFYRQERVGRGGAPYLVTKLRSMRVDAEVGGTPTWASANDPRVTRVGTFLRRTRIDELPQLFSIFTGDMSLVGPRPERPYFVAQLKEQLPLYGLRDTVRPGVTGWAQIGYPYGATVEDARAKLEFDLYWIRHRSFFLYLSVCFHTARVVLTGKGAR